MRKIKIFILIDSATRIVLSFNFGRSTFLTLTISDDYIDDDKAIKFFRSRLERYLLAQGISFYIIIELGDLTHRLHYHLILFNAPYFIIEELCKVWHIGNVKIQEVKNTNGTIYYLAYYIKKGLNMNFYR